MPAPSLGLFFCSVIGLGIFFYYFLFRKETVRKWGSTSRFIMNSLLVISSIVFVWGVMSYLVNQAWGFR
jgi:multisubunit Na+/H+ antiporter MnhB subunit